MREFYFITTLWGLWHVDCFLRGTLPTLLAPNNLPALAKVSRCTYKIYTTKPSALLLNAHPLFAVLKSTVSLELNEVDDSDNIHAGMQVSWWQKGVDDARDAGAIAVSVHPDVLWSDGTFANAGRFFAKGGKAIYMPNIRVVSETLLPAIAARAQGSPPVISLSGVQAANLAVKHLHPLAAVRLPTTARVSAANEFLFAEPGKGLVMRQLTYTAIAADPNTCFVDFEFFVRDMESLDGCFVPRKVDEMLMLSLAPFGKDFGVFEFDQKLNPLHQGRWAAHPTNYTPLNEVLVKEVLWLPLMEGSGLAAPKGNAAHQSLRYMSQSVAAMRATRLFHRLAALPHCAIVRRMIACALHETDLLTKLDCSAGAVTVFVPVDSGALAAIADELLTPGNEAELVRTILTHIVSVETAMDDGETLTSLAGTTMQILRKPHGHCFIGGRQIQEEISVDRMRVFMIDGVLGGFMARRSLSRRNFRARIRKAWQSHRETMRELRWRFRPAISKVRKRLLRLAKR